MLDAEPDLSDRLFSDFDFSSGAVAAVSGGSDSTALLFLLKDYLDRSQPTAKLLAVTIDHGLRPDSAAEARAVAGLCADHGIPHRSLIWSGAKPSTGIAAAAREARYRLLAEAAGAEGIHIVLTGHTADDQAETVLMRQAREEGARADARGLAGMAPATLYDWRTWIVRPLLGTRRAALRATLERRRIGWIDDPTNVDQRFERPRMRAALARTDGETRFARAIATAAGAAVQRREIGSRAARLIDAMASRPVPGLVRLDRDFASVQDGEAAIHALRLLLATVGGVPFLADEGRSRALFERLRAGPLRATLSRTVVDARRAGIFLHREGRNLPAEAAPVDGMLWDGRRRITLNDRPGGLVIAPAGPAAATDAVAGDGVPPSLLRAARAAEPGLWRGGKCLDFAGEGAAPPVASSVAVVSPFARFLPSFDLSAAAAVASLVGAPPLPLSPFRGHDRGPAWAKA